MRPPTIAVLSLLGVLLAASTANAEPIFSDRLVITAADGTVVVDVKRFESTPSLPELAITSGPLRVPHDDMNVDAGVILTEPKDDDFNSDWVRVSVSAGRRQDVLHILFKSDPDEKSLKIPKDFPKNPARIAETGELQDVTDLLFPQYAAAGKAAPFTVEVQSGVDADEVGFVPPVLVGRAPEPASLALLTTGVLTLGCYAWRRRTRTGQAAAG
jgi:PEP-CTERM motif